MFNFWPDSTNLNFGNRVNNNGAVLIKNQMRFEQENKNSLLCKLNKEFN